MVDMFMGFVIGIMVTIYVINKYFRVERPYAFSWECYVDGCKFSVGTDSEDPGLLMAVIEQHEENHNI